MVPDGIGSPELRGSGHRDGGSVSRSSNLGFEIVFRTQHGEFEDTGIEYRASTHTEADCSGY
jgi:hypothetical protein